MKSFLKKDGLLDNYFEVTKRNSNVKKEIVSGFTTFITIAYILVVNPMILSTTGMSGESVFTATAISIIVSTIIMGVYAKMPFVQAPAMGLNIFFAYTIVLQMGHSYEFALTAVLIEGIIFILLNLFNIRESIDNLMPNCIKKGITVGIGLFIALVGLEQAGIIVQQGDGSTLLALGNLDKGQALLTIVGIIIIGILLTRKIKGALFIGMILTAIIGIPFGLTELPKSIFSMPPSISDVFLKFQIHGIISIDMLMVIITLLILDIISTSETTYKISKQFHMIDEKGKVENKDKMMLANSIGTTIGAFLGTSSIGIAYESKSGIKKGGKTGITSIVVAILFIIAIFFEPLFKTVTPGISGAILIIIGMFMIEPIRRVDFKDYSEMIPVFLTTIMIPFSYSVIDGILFGIIAFIILKVVSGKIRNISVVTIVIGIIFLLGFCIK